MLLSVVVLLLFVAVCIVVIAITLSGQCDHFCLVTVCVAVLLLLLSVLLVSWMSVVSCCILFTADVVAVAVAGPGGALSDAEELSLVHGVCPCTTQERSVD